VTPQLKKRAIRGPRKSDSCLSKERSQWRMSHQALHSHLQNAKGKAKVRDGRAIHPSYTWQMASSQSSNEADNCPFNEADANAADRLPFALADGLN